MKWIVVLLATGIFAEIDARRVKRQFPRQHKSSIGDQFGNQFFAERRYPKKQQFVTLTTTTRQPAQVSNVIAKSFSQNNNRSPPNQLTSLMPILFQSSQSQASVQQCASTCVGRTTAEYNPVCGTDGENYHNQARLDCARDCGINVKWLRAGTCRSLLSSVLTGDLPPS